jgi:RNA polymerase sigma-70 factor (ECF subfamily)
LRDRASAEELAQDVFLQLFQNLEKIQSEAHAQWWLRRAICHRSIDEARKRRLRPKIGLESVADPAVASQEPDWMENERLRRLLDRLPHRARMIVSLRYQEDMDPSEIAALLEIPVSTVKSHLHRSLALLRTRLERQGVCS